MRYFTKFILLLLCVTVWTGYNALAYQETNSSPQKTDNPDVLKSYQAKYFFDEPLRSFYEQAKSFFDTVNQSTNLQCRVHLERSFTNTSLIEFYGSVVLLDRIRSELLQLRLDDPRMTSYSYLFHILSAVSDYEDIVTHNLSSEYNLSSAYIDPMRKELEELQEQWSLCLEGHLK